MPTTRRELFKSSLATAAALASAPFAHAVAPRPAWPPHYIATPAQVVANMAKLNLELTRPVFKRELFPSPVVIDSIELLHYKKSWLCRVRSKDGAEGISISNAQQMATLYPVFMERIAPFFLEQDVRDLERQLDLCMVFQSNYKATGMAMFVPLATLEFAILDLFGKMAKRPIGLLISDKIYNPTINVYQANGERYITPEVTIEHLKRDVAISHAKAIKFKLGGRMSHVETPPDRSARLIPMVRKTFGDDMVISADSNGSYGVEEAIRIGKIMQEYNYAFYEEPVQFDDYDGLQQVADALQIPIALGEQEPSTWNFRHVLAHNAVGIVQQDMFYFGGMVRCMRIARMAAVLGKQCIPHISSTGLGYLYMMHFVSAITNSGPYHEFKEFNNDLPYTCTTSTLRSDDNGVITVPTGPGVGVEIDPAYIAKHEVMKVIRPTNFKDAE
jgi:L-alanine-DL-glutamate epimerase-like enolase superfamily enzyme